MLAVQRPSMGSSKPPNFAGDMPFGYSFDTSPAKYPFPSPPAPAPGPSLLDDNESKFLDNFFDGVSSDQFNYDFFSSGPDGLDSGMGWDEVPPTFVGTSSSYGQQPQINPGAPNPNYAPLHTQNASTHAITSTTSADVLAAATLLSNGRSQSLGGDMLRGQLSMQPPSNALIRPHSISEQGHSAPLLNYPQQSNGDDYMRDNFYTDMVFGSQSGSTMRRPRAQQKFDLRWGSDAGFDNAHGFVPPPSLENVAASERSHIQSIEQAFSINTATMSSAENTRPSSPIRTRDSLLESTSRINAEDEDSKPRKRRKSRYKEEEDDEEDDDIPTISKSSLKKRKSVKEGPNQSPISEDTSNKRRKSTAPPLKPTRENLTEDQKRENHIKSEQKRRTLIREGFEDLNELVPGLRGGGFSKSAVLVMTADWLEELIQGNEVLQVRLNQMEGTR